MSDASDIAADLKADGQPMTLTRTTTGVFDPVTGETTGGITQTFTVYGITKNYGTQTKIGADNNPNSLIRGGDKQAIIGADVTEPAPGDTLTVMGINWVVMSLDELSPQGVALIYNLQIRK